jgi:mRNA turnover protein 4
MPKSKRSKTFNLTQVTKKGREQKDKLFQNIRDAIPEYQHCIVFSVDNMRNNYLKDVRRELSDSRYSLRATPQDFSHDSFLHALLTRIALAFLDSFSARLSSWPRPWARLPKRPPPLASTAYPST